MKKITSFLLPVLLFSGIAAGQAIRINFSDSPRITLLLIDFFSIAFAFLALAYLLLAKQLTALIKSIWSFGPWKLLLIFIVWAIVSLLLNFNEYSNKQFFVALSYLLRFSLLFFLSAFLFFCFTKKKLQIDWFVPAFLIFSGFILIVGYFQLVFMPDFSVMAQFGWDPHQGRMLSTFFDPNYLGTFFVLLSSVILGLFLSEEEKNKRKIYLLFFFLVWFGLYLAYSRSAWAQGAIALPLVAYRKDWKLSVAIFAVFVLVVFIPNRLGSRIAQSTSIISKNTSSENYDPSAAARGASIKDGLNLARQNWIYGVGYNAYGYAMQKSGVTTSRVADSMAGQGSDSSLLNVLVTTGTIGFIIFLAFFASLAKNFYIAGSKGDYLSWSLFSFTLAWVPGSFFNNTLFYVLILLPFLILASYSLTRRENG